jgi:hypothetical protein
MPSKLSTKPVLLLVCDFLDAGVLTTEGVVLATEKLETSFLLEENTVSDKIYCIDKHLYCVVSGLSADANFLIDLSREEAQKYRLKFREPMPIEQLIVYICDTTRRLDHRGPSEQHSFLLATTHKTSISYIQRIRQATTLAGKPLPSAPTISQLIHS